MYKFLPLTLVKKFVPLMAARGVSVVARSPRGFLTAYKRASGASLSDEWKARREAFITRHMAQVIQNDESLYLPDGSPTRRHLALVAWAFSPDTRANLSKAKQNFRGERA